MRSKGMRMFIRLATALLVCALVPGAALAASVEAGKTKARQCVTCHGMDGMARQPDAANIGGESEMYLENQLRAFRTGERQHPQMSVIAQGLSDEDIADLAAYYAAIRIKVEETP